MDSNKYRDRIIKMGLESESKILLPETNDSRIKDASNELRSLGFDILNTEDFQDKFPYYLKYISRQNFAANWPEKNMCNYLKEPLHFAMTIIACDDADGLVAGAVTESSKVIRAAIRIIGIQPSSGFVSSVFFMISPNGNMAYTFADCAVIPEPDSKQLAVIGAEAANMHRKITGEEPIVAFLSFSTKGSAKHYRVEKVRKAVEIFSHQNPNVIHDGEIQLDAAIIPEINHLKISNSPIEGKANVLIFPNLDAGNIAYKITQRMGGYSSWGPLLQGLKKPVHDLSRGCSIDDIINVAAISALQRN